MEQNFQHGIFHLDSNQIKLPSNAYPLQKRMVAQIFSAISQRKSLILESPTGTGKTLCLLSSTLQAIKQKGIQRIFYLTKTHTQMNGIINEIKNTSYKPEFVVAQSKKALCAHKPAIEQGAEMNIQEFNGLCYLAQSNSTKARSIVEKCPLLTKVQADKINFPPFNEIRSQKDIKTYAQGLGLCPERYQSALSTKAQLIIMPYIYMINGFIFSHKNFNLQNSVFLFDQAHNILQMAQQQSSTSISQRTIQQSKKQISTLKILVNNQMLNNPRGEDIVAKYQALNGLEKYLFELSSLKQQLKKQFKQKGETQLILGLSQIKSKIKTTIKGFITFRAINRQYLQELTTDLRNFQEGKKKIFYINALVNICFKLDEILNKTDSKYFNDYICVLYKQGKYGEQKFKVKFHCMTSKPVFDRLNQYNSTFIFASGTLNVSDFKNTGLTFINNFAPRYPEQNPYPNNNVQTFVVSRFQGKDLQIDYKNPNYNMVANYIKSVAPSIKNGILIFFKSYSYLIQFRKYLENNYFDFDKPTFFEDRVMVDFQEQIIKYKQAALLDRGAIMFACMRGKASEGCNFENQYARAVFIIGMPFGNINSIEAKIHQQYIKDFQTWYNSGALLAVNQAIGRVVRHQNDYGLIFILGKKLSQFVSKLSQWIQYNKIQDNLDIMQTNTKIKKFFSSKSNQQNKPVSYDSSNNYQDILNQQILQMWDGESDQQIQTYSKSYSFDYNSYNKQKSSFLSNPVFSLDYPKPKPNFVKKEQQVKIEEVRQKKSLNRIIQPESDDEQERILLQTLERSKRQK